MSSGPQPCRRKYYRITKEGRAQLAAHRQQWKAVDGTPRNLDAGMHGMTVFADQPLEEQIAQWRTYLRRQKVLHGPDVEELEGHLRDQLAALTEAGLAGDEAFLVAVKRMGSLDALSREFARAHSERLWKQLVMPPDADAPANTARAEILVVLSLAVVAALAVKVPALFGLRINGAGEPLYVRNASLFVLPRLTVYFLWKRGSAGAIGLWLAVPFAAAGRGAWTSLDSRASLSSTTCSSRSVAASSRA
jgi:DNA-binding PadR family transcriptional regulator